MKVIATTEGLNRHVGEVMPRFPGIDGRPRTEYSAFEKVDQKQTSFNASKGVSSMIVDTD